MNAVARFTSALRDMPSRALGSPHPSRLARFRRHACPAQAMPPCLDTSAAVQPIAKQGLHGDIRKPIPLVAPGNYPQSLT
ncbi:hypothetical protein [Pseudomonas indica]|uniref:hypothetical protein n=1 Tax=Pseudomonas indica TaxID=137658 RepID=UPI00114110F1|nr:hypothetical protein [Pseudomonas indica]MBU3055961.1 hypothetical protein [Pseudomonas indica]